MRSQGARDIGGTCTQGRAWPPGPRADEPQGIGEVHLHSLLTCLESQGLSSPSSSCGPTTHGTHLRGPWASPMHSVTSSHRDSRQPRSWAGTVVNSYQSITDGETEAPKAMQSVMELRLQSESPGPGPFPSARPQPPLLWESARPEGVTFTSWATKPGSSQLSGLIPSTCYGFK